jgi:hypothetical protein
MQGSASAEASDDSGGEGHLLSGRNEPRAAARPALQQDRGVPVDGLDFWGHEAQPVCLARVIARVIGSPNEVLDTFTHDRHLCRSIHNLS